MIDGIGTLFGRCWIPYQGNHLSFSFNAPMTICQPLLAKDFLAIRANAPTPLEQLDILDADPHASFTADHHAPHAREHCVDDVDEDYLTYMPPEVQWSRLTMISATQPWGRLVINLGYKHPGLGVHDNGPALPGGGLAGNLVHLLRAVRLNEVRPRRNNQAQFPTLERALTLSQAVEVMPLFLARIIALAFTGLEAPPPGGEPLASRSLASRPCKTRTSGCLTSSRPSAMPPGSIRLRARQSRPPSLPVQPPWFPCVCDPASTKSRSSSRCPSWPCLTNTTNSMTRPGLRNLRQLS